MSESRIVVRMGVDDIMDCLSESQRSEIETLIEKRLRENFDNYKKEFENL